MFDMRRRDLITLLGGAAVGWPLVARAQQAAPPTIGLLDPRSPGTVEDLLRAFRQGLKETGYVEGENVTIVYRFAEGQFDRLPELAVELVRRRVSMIAATAIAAASAAKAATETMPIVSILAEDPVRRGLVSSLARPGGNLTGINFLTLELVAKRLEILRELVPALIRLAVLVNPGNAASTETMLGGLEPAASAMGLQIQVLNASTGSEIHAAFATFVRERPDALFVNLDPFFTSRRVQLATLATRHAIPMTSGNRQITEAGGLMSYGASTTDAWRQAGVYSGLVLKGAKPADLPFVQASKFELVINAETARMLGLTVPPSLLALADEVIE
jgi:putative tryptophan/tyrosine transport system substrate-binding protein